MYECKRCFEYKTNLKTDMKRHLKKNIKCPRKLESYKYDENNYYKDGNLIINNDIFFFIKRN